MWDNDEISTVDFQDRKKFYLLGGKLYLLGREIRLNLEDQANSGIQMRISHITDAPQNLKNITTSLTKAQFNDDEA